MVDYLRKCPVCDQFVHVSKLYVGWRGCWDCEQKKRNQLAAAGLVSPDAEYARAEEKIWRYAKARGLKIDRLID